MFLSCKNTFLIDQKFVVRIRLSIRETIRRSIELSARIGRARESACRGYGSNGGDTLPLIVLTGQEPLSTD
jgi:hypothetical protein